MHDATKGTRHKLEKDVQALIRDTKELLRATAENATGDAAELRKRLEERLEGVQKNVKEGAQGPGDELKDGLDATDEVIRGYPYQAMGVSLVVGVLLGMLFRRRH